MTWRSYTSGSVDLLFRKAPKHSLLKMKYKFLLPYILREVNLSHSVQQFDHFFLIFACLLRTDQGNTNLSSIAYIVVVVKGSFWFLHWLHWFTYPSEDILDEPNNSATTLYSHFHGFMNGCFVFVRYHRGVDWGREEAPYRYGCWQPKMRQRAWTDRWRIISNLPSLPLTSQDRYQPVECRIESKKRKIQQMSAVW